MSASKSRCIASRCDRILEIVLPMDNPYSSPLAKSSFDNGLRGEKRPTTSSMLTVLVTELVLVQLLSPPDGGVWGGYVSTAVAVAFGLVHVLNRLRHRTICRRGFGRNWFALPVYVLASCFAIAFVSWLL